MLADMALYCTVQLRQRDTQLCHLYNIQLKMCVQCTTIEIV